MTALLATLALLVCGGSGVGVGAATSLNGSGVVITEDDPRFDCRVHGNRVCG